MENLFELVRRTLQEKGVRQEDFAEQLGVKRQQLTQWARSMPAAATLRSIAQALDVPYGRVLVAALRSGRYADNLSDVLTGLPVRAVVRSPASGYDLDEDDQRVAVFSGGDLAERFRYVSDQVCPGSFETVDTIVDAAPVPEHVVVYSTVWERVGGVEQTEDLYPKIPDELTDRDVSAVRAGVLSDPYGVFELRALSLDKASGLSAVQEALDTVRARDEVLPSHIPAPDFIQRAAALRRAYATAEHYLPPLVSPGIPAFAGQFTQSLNALMSMWPDGLPKPPALQEQSAAEAAPPVAFSQPLPMMGDCFGFNTPHIQSLRPPDEVAELQQRILNYQGPLVRYMTIKAGE